MDLSRKKELPRGLRTGTHFGGRGSCWAGHGIGCRKEVLRNGRRGLLGRGSRALGGGGLRSLGPGPEALSCHRFG